LNPLTLLKLKSLISLELLRATAVVKASLVAMANPRDSDLVDLELTRGQRGEPDLGEAPLPPQLSTQLRLQQYHARFAEYDNTWAFSARRPGLLEDGVLPAKSNCVVVIGALFLLPFLFDLRRLPGGRLSQPELAFSPRFVWFRLRRRTPLQRLMFELAKAVDVDPSRLYFYHKGAQVHPQSTAETVLLPFSLS
jgi:hypothetical protein